MFTPFLATDTEFIATDSGCVWLSLEPYSLPRLGLVGRISRGHRTRLLQAVRRWLVDMVGWSKQCACFRSSACQPDASGAARCGRVQWSHLSSICAHHVFPPSKACSYQQVRCSQCESTRTSHLSARLACGLCTVRDSGTRLFTTLPPVTRPDRLSSSPSRPPPALAPFAAAPPPSLGRRCWLYQ